MSEKQPMSKDELCEDFSERLGHCAQDHFKKKIVELKLKEIWGHSRIWNNSVYGLAHVLFLIAWRTKKYFKNCILYIMKNIIGFIGM